MYALVNGQELLLGPIAFNYRMINSVLEEELEVNFRVTSQDYLNVPITFTEDIKILPARNEVPEYDPRFQTVSQSSHEITDTEVVFYYGVSDKPLEQIKEEYKAAVAPERWKKENTTVTVTINDNEITVSTSRDNRLSIVSKLLSGDGPYNFKFNDGVWEEISKTDLQTILTEIDTVVQAAFDWELAKLAEIDACEDGEAVYAVVIVAPPVETPVIPNA
jgi:hypothetical protein